LRSLDDCPVIDELFQNNILDPQDARLTQHLTREDFDYWIQQRSHDQTPGDDEPTYEMWQEEPAEMKDALYKVVNQAIQNGQMPTSWEGALTTLIPKKVGEEKFLESIRPICLMNTAAKIVTSVWAKRLSKSLAQQSVFEGLDSSYEHSHMRVIHADGKKSAKILLHRGLRQDCPLSPILRGVVMNAMLRWLDFKGGVLSQGDVVTNTLCFADDSTLMTTNVRYECSFSLRQQLLPMGGC